MGPGSLPLPIMPLIEVRYGSHRLRNVICSDNKSAVAAYRRQRDGPRRRPRRYRPDDDSAC